MLYAAHFAYEIFHRDFPAFYEVVVRFLYEASCVLVRNFRMRESSCFLAPHFTCEMSCFLSLKRFHEILFLDFMILRLLLDMSMCGFWLLFAA